MTAFLARNRKTTIVSVALVLAVMAAAGGGYALAASKTKTITVCADKGTGVMHLKTHGKCNRGQTRVTWNQKGPQGVQGFQGPAGPPGTSAVSVWANVTNSGALFAGQGLSVQHVSAGTYEVTVTSAQCAQGANAPIVTVSDGNPPAGQATGAFPVAWFGATGLNQQFMVFTGVVSSGTFTATDHTFTVMDSCT
jgi:hypothetical protein